MAAGAAFADSAAKPKGYKAKAAVTRMTAAGGSGVLLIKDVDPWGNTADEQVLSGLGMAYDVISSSAIATTALSNYCLVIVAGDQPTSFYETLQSNMAQLEGFVSGGGALEIHAADGGWNGGSWSVMPGGVTHTFATDDLNYVVDPTNPIVAGVPSPFTGTLASHGSFTNLPEGTSVITTDSAGAPTTVIYKIGAGTVVAAEGPLEYGYATGESTGVMLANMIPYTQGFCGSGIHGKTWGVRLRHLQCDNATTGQSVSGPAKAGKWSCAELGLRANPGETVRVTLDAIAR